MATVGSQSSVAGEGSDNFKVDAASPLWKYTIREQQVVGGGSYYWKCKFCDSNKGKAFNSSYSRVKLHFMGPSGKGMAMCKGRSGKGLSDAQIASFVKEQEIADNLVKRSKQSFYKPPPGKNKSNTQLPIEPIQSSQHPFLQVPVPEENEEVEMISRKRGPLDNAFKMEAREHADEAIARCLYANGIPFNLVRSPYWKEMVAAINKAPADYTSPGFEKVRTTLLQKEKTSVDKALQPIRASWKTSGITIVSDGWKDTKNRPLINVIAMSPKGAMFLKAVDCEGEVKDANFISRILIEAIEMVGNENVVQVVTDNAKNCRGAGALVEGRYEHIFWTPCTVHSVNLIMQQIGTQIDWVKQIYQEGEEIQMFVTNHHMSQSMFRSFSKLELLKVAETRFASHTIVMRRLVKVKEALCQMVISNQWGIWKVSNSERAQKVKALILDDNWWARVQYVLDFTDPIMTMLRFADRDTPCLGDVYDGMDTTVEKVKLQIQKHENDPIECEALCNKVEGIILHRWEKMTNPLHLLAYALSPRYYSDEVLSMPGRIAPYMDEEVTTGSYKAFVRLFPDKEMQTKVRQEFGLFSSGEKLSPYAINDRNNMELGAITWWYMYGQPFKYLQPLAIKILSQVASSSAAERNWSTYSFIHSVKRNRLGSKKAEDLVYIHTNLRLLSRKEEDYKKGPSKLWDVTPECANLDATIQDLTETMDDGDNTISTHDIGASSTSGTALASNDLELAAHGDDQNVDFLANPYDSGSDY